VAALIATAINPVVVGFVDRFRSRSYRVGVMKRRKPHGGVTGLSDHVVLCGFTGVAQRVAKRLELEQIPYVVIDQASAVMVNLRRSRVPCVNGDAASPDVLRQANVAFATAVLVTVSEPVTAQAVVARARRMNHKVTIVALADSAQQEKRLRAKGATEVVRGDKEIGRFMELALLQRRGEPVMNAAELHWRETLEPPEPKAALRRRGFLAGLRGDKQGA
jgi:voltage-gated potassium channel Kch